jgi:hypothetical protein
MQIEKLMQAVGYLLKKYKRRLNYTKLIKELYLTGRESLKETNQAISGDSYVNMKNGTVSLSAARIIAASSLPAATYLAHYRHTRYLSR